MKATRHHHLARAPHRNLHRLNTVLHATRLDLLLLTTAFSHDDNAVTELHSAAYTLDLALDHLRRVREAKRFRRRAQALKRKLALSRSL